MTHEQDRLTQALADRYRIERELGAGGMATVYLAHDLKHEREVAIKVLHPDLGAALGAERFLTEIKTTAKLQHPHILPLLDSGAADGLLFYVMPYVRGETLRARLQRETQLPVTDALRIATEVADALTSAHETGIVHRDIKPENILLQGTHALVADFGIALAVQQAGGARMTQTGLSLGTPQYMAPEQAMGDRAVDHRADVYALGAVTYEMLTGEPPHTGANAQAIVAKLLSEPVRSMTVLRPAVPPYVDAAVQLALQKLPADRFATVREFADALRGGSAARASALATTAAAVRRPSWSGAQAALALALALAAGATGWLSRPVPTPPTLAQQIVLYKTALPSAAIETDESQVDVAPDGSAIAYADSTPTGWMIFRKARASAEGHPLIGTEGGKFPFFSPDSKWIGFSGDDNRLRKIPSEGGSGVTLGTAIPIASRVAWLDDGTIVFATSGAELVQLSANGEERKRAKLKAAVSGGVLSLSALPGGRGVLFGRCRGTCQNSSVIFAYDFVTGEEREILKDGVSPRYSPTGHLLFLNGAGAMFAVRFDVKTLTASGDRVPVMDGPVRTWTSVTAAGAFLYALDDQARGRRTLAWVDRAGKATAVDSGWNELFGHPAISPDGRSFAVSVADEKVWVRRADGGRQKLEAPGANSRATWFPDGRSVAVLASEPGNNAVRLVRVPMGGGATTELLRAPYGVWEADFTPDTSWVVYRTSEPDAWRVRARRLHGDTTSIPVPGDSGNTGQIALSPDGRWLAMTSGVNANAGVYVVSFPPAGSPRLVSRGGGTEPRWSRSGRELFFVSKGMLMSVAVKPGPTFEPSEPKPLFAVDAYLRAANRQMYDVAPGDNRFLMVKLPPKPPVPTLVYVENWLSELLAKVKP